MEAQHVLSADDQQEVIYLVVDENSQGQQVTQIVSDGQLLGQQAQIIMQDGKQAVLITEGNQQQVVLLEDDVGPEHVHTALQQGAIQQNIVQQSTPQMVVSQTPAAPSTSAVNGGQVQYLVTDNGEIITTMNQMTQQHIPHQLMVTQSGLVRVDGSPRNKREAGKSLINQAALQEAASKSPRASVRPEEEVIIIGESPDTKRIQLGPPSTKGTLREFINQAVDKQLSEIAENEQLRAAETQREQVVLPPSDNVDIETEVTTGEVPMDADSKDDTDTIGFGDDDRVEPVQDIEPDSTQSADILNGAMDEQIVETSMETVVSTMPESGMIAVNSEMPGQSALPDQVMAGDEERSMDESEQNLQVPQVINVPDRTVEIDTAQIFGEQEIESSSVNVSDVNSDVFVEDNMVVTSEEVAIESSEVIQSTSQQELLQTLKQPGPQQETLDPIPQPPSTIKSPLRPTSTLIIHEPEVKKKAPEALIPTTVITVISPPTSSRRKSHHKEKQDESESESQSDSHLSSHTSSPRKSPVVAGESIASRRERRTSKPTRYYGLDVDYEVFPTDIYRSYKRGSESGEDSSAGRMRKDHGKVVEVSHDSDMQSADEEKMEKKRGRPKIEVEEKIEKKRGRSRKTDVNKTLEDNIESDILSADEGLVQQEHDLSKSDKDDKVEKKRGRPRKSDAVKHVVEQELDDSQESDLQSADEDILPKKRGRQKVADAKPSPKKRGRPKKSETMKQKEEPIQQEEQIEESEELDELIIAEDIKAFQPDTVISEIASAGTQPVTLEQAPDLQDSYFEDITPVEDEVAPAVKRGRGRPAKKRSITGKTEDQVVSPIRDVTSTKKGRERSPRLSTEVVVEAEIHQSPEDTDEPRKAEGDSEEMDISIAEEIPPVVDSITVEFDGGLAKEVPPVVDSITMVSGLTSEQGTEPVSEDICFTATVDQNEEVLESIHTVNDDDGVDDKVEPSEKTPKRGKSVKDDIKTKKRSSPSAEVTSDHSKQDGSEGDSPRRSHRAKEDINYTESSEEDGAESSSQAKTIKVQMEKNEQLQAENDCLYSLQKEVTDLKFVNDSLESRLAQQSGSPDEIRSLQARIDKLQMRNSELETKLKTLDKSQKIGINIKGMKFSVKKDNSATSTKPSENSVIKLREIDLAEQELKVRETLLEKREMKAKAMDNELDERGAMLTKRESKLDRWERKLKSQEKEIEYKEKQNRRFENDLRDLGGSGSARKKHGFTEDLELIVQKKELLEREEEIDQREAAMLAKEKLLAATEQQLKALNTELNEKAEYLQAREQSHSSGDEESVVDTDSSSSVKGKSPSTKSQKVKTKAKSPRGRDVTQKSALTRNLLTVRRTSSVSSQEDASDSAKSKSMLKKTAKKMTGSPATASAKRKGSQTNRETTPVSSKKLKTTPRTGEKKAQSSKNTNTPEKKSFSLNSPTAKSRKSEGRNQSPAVVGQKRKRMSDVKSPQPNKTRKK